MKHLLTYVALLLFLIGCTPLQGRVTSEPSMNESKQAIQEVLLRHPDFPDLQGNEERTINVQSEKGRTVKTIFSSKIKLVDHIDVNTKQKETYHITLRKEWEQDGEEYTNVWKYEYNGERQRITLMEHQIEDRPLSSI